MIAVMYRPRHADPVILLTGASSGIGAATAVKLHRAGFRLVLTARREDRIQELVAGIENGVQRIEILGGDVTVARDRERWVRHALARFGRIDGLVNNAGYGQRGSVEEVSLEAMRRNFETNVFGAIEMIRLTLPHLRRSRFGTDEAPARTDSGRIVNVSSVAGRIARPLSATYDATKHALEAYTDGLRLELAAEGIPVISIQPGFIRTDFSTTSRRESAAELQRVTTGPYRRLWERVQGGEAKLKRWAAGPEVVADVIVRAFVDPNPRWRYVVPGHARLFLLLKRLLPERLFALGMPQ